MARKLITGLLTADYQAGSRLCPIPPDLELPTISWKPNKAQLYLWEKWQNMLEILPKKLDFYIHLGETLQGPASKKGSSYELLTNDAEEQSMIARAMLGPVVGRVKDHPDGGKAFWLCRGSGWHEGEYGRAADMVARSLDAQKFPNGEQSGDVLDLNFDGIICNFSHHSSVFMIYFSTPLEREMKFFAEGAEQIEAEVDGELVPVVPDLVARAHTHREIVVERNGRVAISVPGWMLATRYAMKKSIARAWPSLGFTLVWLDPEAKRKGRRSIWQETILYPHPRRRAVRIK
jgi:hypothetical protein